MRRNAPLVSIPKGKFGAEWKVLTREDATTLIKGAAAEFNISSKLVATHSRYADAYAYQELPRFCWPTYHQKQYRSEDGQAIRLSAIRDIKLN